MPSWLSVMQWYGPAISVVKYVANGRVGANCQRPGSS
jgi:hypothetical protein